MNRRDFLALIGTTGAIAGCGGRLPTFGLSLRTPLPTPDVVSAQGLTLVAKAATAAIGDGHTSPVWTLNGTYPGPTIRARPGDIARVVLENELPEETIIHWHGLNVPQEADGHPRLAIESGQSFAYEFPIIDRPGTYWYHPHPHGRTAPQTYRGMAGFFIVEQPEETALGLPAGDREVLLLLQDKRLDDDGRIVYAPFGPDRMFGYMGDTAFVNGVTGASLEVEPRTYRFRILNGANARIFKLALSDGGPMTLIGTDGGLLEEPDQLTDIMLATAERADVLIDFSRYAPGDRLLLRSVPFEIPGMMGAGMGGSRGMGGGGIGQRGMGRGMGGMMSHRQGTELDLLEIVVVDRHGESDKPDPTLPARLAEIPSLPVDRNTPRRRFEFQSAMMNHSINGRSFRVDRVDFEIPLGRTEVWVLDNTSSLPHPVHVHAGQFRVQSRSGGRNRLMPWERGLKDTVLVLPGERVEIAVRFPDYRGLYLMHCHNLEHEDAGMMLNFAVV